MQDMEKVLRVGLFRLMLDSVHLLRVIAAVGTSKDNIEWNPIPLAEKVI